MPSWELPKRGREESQAGSAKKGKYKGNKDEMMPNHHAKNTAAAHIRGKPFSFFGAWHSRGMSGIVAVPSNLACVV